MKPIISLSTIAATADKYLNTFLEDYSAVINKNSHKNVHAARISSRRLRACLRILSCFGHKQEYKEQRKYLRKFGRRQGRVREVDVQIIFLKTLVGKLSDRTLMSGIMEILKHRRKLAYKVFKGYHCRKNNKTLLKLKKYFEAFKNDTSRYSNEKVRKLVLKYLEKLLSIDPNACDELHSMRITAKKLRYTLELLEPFYGNDFHKPIASAHSIQDVLGDFQEMNVWLEFLKENKIYKSTMLHKICLSRKKSALDCFLRIWADQKETKIWENLKKAL